MTYYEVLGVPETATADELKKAYRKLASQHHPDRGGDTKKFQEIQVAYDTLSDASKRQQYDLERQGRSNIHFTWHTDGHPNIDEVFRNFGFGNSNHFEEVIFGRRPKKNKDIKIEINIHLLDTLTPLKKDISVQTTKGERQSVTVEIPRGVTNGATIRYPGLGDNFFNTLDRGDLYVQINVHNDSKFRPVGIDLYTELRVNCLQAIVGGTAIISGIDNKQFELTIPPGTQAGTKFRIQGQGLYQLNSNNRGHLYIELALEVPQNFTEEQINLLRGLINTK